VLEDVYPDEKAAEIRRLTNPARSSRWSATAATTPPRSRRCIDILTQIAAVRAALESVSFKIVEDGVA